MSKSDEQRRRDERLAAKLRENLKRRKVEAKARAADAQEPVDNAPDDQNERN